MRHGFHSIVAVCLALFLAFPVSATDPAPTLDELLNQFIELDKKETEAVKAKNVLKAAIKLRVQELNTKLVQLGILVDPPGPMPPADDLPKRLKDAFLADGGSKEDAKTLCELYKQAALLAQKKNSPTFEVKSSKELLERITDTASKLLTDETLPAVRGIVASELLKAFGMTSDDPMTDEKRAAIVATLTKLATILEGF